LSVSVWALAWEKQSESGFRHIVTLVMSVDEKMVFVQLCVYSTFVYYCYACDRSVSHSVMSDMKVIEQEKPAGSNSALDKYMSRGRNDDDEDSYSSSRWVVHHVICVRLSFLCIVEFD
jgi:hypothetical protein